MKHKLLVLTSGTVAAGVGIELLKQLDARPKSKLNAMVRYLDIAETLPSVYGGNIIVGEWKAMQLSEQYMRFIQEHMDRLDRKQQDFFYPGLPPRTEGAGGGGVRYNGAGAVLFNWEELMEWVAAGMDTLAQRDDGQADLSVVLVVSPVGATGSGSVERLIELTQGAAVKAGLSKELHCDVFILHPGTQNVQALGLANTFALYAEMAASRMAQHTLNYKGRTILMGWGTDTRTTNLMQLQETTATLIRVLNDPLSGMADEYRHREVDHSVLIAKDDWTNIPSHLSTATCVTITMGDLKEQIIRYDTSRILGTLVYGDEVTKALEGEANIFREALVSCLSGKDSGERYSFLLNQIEKEIELSSLQITEDDLKKLSSERQRTSLDDYLTEDTKRIKTKTQVPQQLQEEGKDLYSKIVAEMNQARQDAVATGFSLARIKKDYEAIRDELDLLLTYAQRTKVSVSSDETGVREYLRPDNIRRRQGMENALAAVQQHVRDALHAHTAIVARQFLNALKNYCRDVITKLSTIQQAAPRPVNVERDWANIDRLPLSIQVSHPLQMPALTAQQTRSYYEQVSVYAVQEQAQEDFFASEDEAIEEDALAHLRSWLSGNNLQKKNLLDLPFTGDYEKFSQAIEMYARDKVDKKVKEHSVLDVLLKASQNGENVLEQQLSQAAIKAQPLIKFNPKLAKGRMERWHVCTYYQPAQLIPLETAVNNAFRQRGCTVRLSEDPTEITIVYYIDGLPMSSITDLTGRCLKEFLDYRKKWYSELNGHSNGTGPTNFSYGSVPVYSGRDAETLVRETKVVRQVYSVRDPIVVAGYNPADFPELQ